MSGWDSSARELSVRSPRRRIVSFQCVRTFLLPPVNVTFTKRLVYNILFLARPLGTFFFSCFSTCDEFASQPRSIIKIRISRLRDESAARDTVWWACANLGSLRSDFAGTGEGSVNFTHDCEVSVR